ncbi:NAD(P)H-dependent oxidoreductase [Nocardia huaxiensis]|uniref:NAD(P)H-dependent oxidoreductase n=1 Tax=Nocardia huaxiensis TaxID=2755382 RepID=A0A7D6YZK5_9NOCA|nr:NAD(P)H-dependent oxidoreductase [Nocardia huaxiensis]QLY28486.1 NAD(P)H-dependent oxidoreductase [Nocardia huaxiensis]
MIKIGIILGSTRPNRNAPQVARWVLEHASRRGDAEFEIIDLKDHPLPHFEEEVPPMFGPSVHAHTRAWAERLAGFDGFIIVTPEYNHGAPGVLKNAIDHAFAEWANKAIGFVSYGVDGGVRAVEQLRSVCGVLGLADVGYQVTLSVKTDFENHTVFRPADRHDVTLNGLLDQLVAWSTALAPLRYSVTDTPDFTEGATHDEQLSVR